MKRNTLMSMMLLPSLVLGLAAVPAHAQGDDEPPKQTSTLDRDLLGDLEKDLLEDLNTPPKKDQESTPELKGQGDGEDLQAPENPLARITEQMRKVQSRIAAADASKSTQRIQQDVIADLNLLIEQLQQQMSQQQKQQQQSPSGQTQAGASAAKQGDEKPTGDSSDRLDEGRVEEVDALAPDQLVKEVWGHLPARVVEQMSRQSVEKFLPKYEQLIEAYFRRLAEEPTP